MDGVALVEDEVHLAPVAHDLDVVVGGLVLVEELAVGLGADDAAVEHADGEDGHQRHQISEQQRAAAPRRATGGRRPLRRSSGGGERLAPLLR